MYVNFMWNSQSINVTIQRKSLFLRLVSKPRFTPFYERTTRRFWTKDRDYDD